MIDNPINRRVNKAMLMRSWNIDHIANNLSELSETALRILEEHSNGGSPNNDYKTRNRQRSRKS
jgi:hypothetical protein